MILVLPLIYHIISTNITKCWEIESTMTHYITLLTHSTHPFTHYACLSSPIIPSFHPFYPYSHLLRPRQRGRDHGIPPYTAWRRGCNLPVPTSANDLAQIMSPSVAQVFQRLYPLVYFFFPFLFFFFFFFTSFYIFFGLFFNIYTPFFFTPSVFFFFLFYVFQYFFVFFYF